MPVNEPYCSIASQEEGSGPLQFRLGIPKGYNCLSSGLTGVTPSWGTARLGKRLLGNSRGQCAGQQGNWQVQRLTLDGPALPCSLA